VIEPLRDRECPQPFAVHALQYLAQQIPRPRFRQRVAPCFRRRSRERVRDFQSLRFALSRMFVNVNLPR